MKPERCCQGESDEKETKEDPRVPIEADKDWLGRSMVRAVVITTS
jgi:hypothetical protein